jgi:hypothetical protein
MLQVKMSLAIPHVSKVPTIILGSEISTKSILLWSLVSFFFCILAAKCESSSMVYWNYITWSREAGTVICNIPFQQLRIIVSRNKSNNVVNIICCMLLTLPFDLVFESILVVEY